MPEIKPDVETFATIKVIGVGGGGGAAVERMIKSKIRGVEFGVINTDIQALHASNAAKKLHIGKSLTRGLGAGMDPDIGKRAAEENQNEIREMLRDSDMIFITCGMGGGTGTGASPIVAEIAKDLGIITIAIITKPFSFEGAKRMQLAEEGINELNKKIDTIITIPNDKLLSVIDKKTSLLDSFAYADNVLRQGVQGISELITIPGLINVDFADVRAIISDAGSALMGIGEASGQDRAKIAAQKAVENPLLDLSINGAQGILFTITGSPDLSIHEVNEAAQVITDSVDPNAKIIFGAVIDESLHDDIKITVVATGFSNNRQQKKSSLSFSENTPIKPPEKISEIKPPEKEKINSDVFKESVASEDIGNNTEDINELDIPAFIRKKMGKQ